MKLKIIGHRGAAGIALENTLTSVRAALEYKVHAVEIDVHLSRDEELIVHHDATFRRTGGGTAAIADTLLSEIRQIRLRGGETIPTLRDVLEIMGSTPLIVEIKVPGAVEKVLAVASFFPDRTIIIASQIHSEITRLKQLRPDIKGYTLVLTQPFEGLHTARALGADGVDMNFWLLNPLTYILAKRRGLDLMVFTINRRFVANLVHKLYPDVLICTDNPHYFAKSRRLKMYRRRSNRTQDQS